MRRAMRCVIALRSLLPARNQRGVAGVEAGLVLSFILIPLVLGVIQFGDYFWRAQAVDTVAPAVQAGQVAGDFTCQGLKDAVAAAVVEVASSLDASLPISASNVSVEVVEMLPDVGVDVAIHIETGLGGLSSLIPLPGGGAIVADFTQRLTDVRITDAVCR